MVALKGEILEYLIEGKRIRPSQLQRRVYRASRTAIHKALKELVEEGFVAKSGKVPKVYYHAVKLKELTEKQWQTKTSMPFQEVLRYEGRQLSSEAKLFIERIL